ncbi:hypothetical protein SB775_29640, partial [Peribacillus sp. SIMBA_075]|uniref:hypothetical protein n=1 Tax=Peribacillus sp. SIMBA_075 TaxID=3085813 RepID=UPI00397CB645
MLNGPAASPFTNVYQGVGDRRHLEDLKIIPMTGIKARYRPEVLDHIAAKRSSFDAAEGAT